MDFSEKVVIVTGASRGLGQEFARQFAKYGANVAVSDLRDCSKTLAIIEENGQQGLATTTDVTSADSTREMAEAVVEKFGRIDVLVNNAGISGRFIVEETSVELWDRVMAVNAKGVFLGAKLAIPVMRQAGGGSIINISSIYGLVGSDSGASYHASKGAVRIFTKSAAIQYAKDGIRVNSVHPGFVDSPMTESYHEQPEIREARVAATPLGRMGLPEDIASGILYLASDESSFVTGSELVIDGGMTAQ